MHRNWEFELYDKVVILDSKGNKRIASVCERRRLRGYNYYIVFTNVDDNYYKFARFESEVMEYELDRIGDLVF